MMEARERQIFEWALAETGTVPGVAALLEVDRAQVYKKFKAFGIPPPERQSRKPDESDEDDSAGSDEQTNNVDDETAATDAE